MMDSMDDDLMAEPYERGLETGKAMGAAEGFTLGAMKASQIGMELGYMRAVALALKLALTAEDDPHPIASTLDSSDVLDARTEMSAVLPSPILSSPALPSPSLSSPVLPSTLLSGQSSTLPEPEVRASNPGCGGACACAAQVGAATEVTATGKGGVRPCDVSMRADRDAERDADTKSSALSSKSKSTLAVAAAVLDGIATFPLHNDWKGDDAPVDTVAAFEGLRAKFKQLLALQRKPQLNFKEMMLNTTGSQASSVDISF